MPILSPIGYAQKFSHRADKIGSHMTKEAAIEKWGLIDNDESKANLIVNNPTGERALHYDLVTYIRMNYPNVILTSSLGENQITHLTRLDSYHKGYQRGTPDLELTCKVGGSVDVVAFELKMWITCSIYRARRLFRQFE